MIICDKIGAGSTLYETPNATNANNARNVNTDGTINNNNAYNGNNGVRPDLSIAVKARGSKECSTNGKSRKHSPLDRALLFDFSALTHDGYRFLSEFKTLYRSHKKTLSGKRWKSGTVRFEMDALAELLKLSRELKAGEYRPGPYNVFEIQDPKPRVIKSIAYRDKVVQRALCDEVLEPVLDRKSIYDSYACRKGKGTHRGLDRTEQFMREMYRRHGTDFYILKCDVEKYFDSIDHEELKKEMRAIFPPGRLLDLIEMIIDSTGSDKGLPLGNQSSQWLSIYHLNDLDHYAKRDLRAQRYIRYMDDFIIFHEDKNELRRMKKAVEEHLNSKGLALNEKSHIFPAKNGLDFLGFRLRVTDTGKVIRKVRQQSVRKMKRKLKKFAELYKAGKRTRKQIEHSYYSWRAHAAHGHSYQLFQNMDARFLKIFEGSEEYGKAVKELTRRRNLNRSRRKVPQKPNRNRTS